ncbi:nucleoside recognition domain-containing protein [Cytophagaceae bacterium ABcell3]|nr:nucleoside recognition domain-containing protein [Cytophagaceae bacterium ABcell3]
MALNYIWVSFFVLGFLMAVVRVVGYYFREFFLQNWNIVFTTEDLNIFNTIIGSVFSSAQASVTLSIGLIGAMALWLGIMKIGEEGGAVNVLARLMGPFFHRLFPEVPKEHPANGSMLMNFSANLLGLDNAATPLGLKAMNQLQEINPDKEKASNAQIMFLVLNTSGLTLIPVSIMALRAAGGSVNPSDIFIPILITTFFSSITGLVAVSIIQKINLLDKVILAYLLGGIVLMGGIIYYFVNLPDEQVGPISSLLGNGIIFSIIIAFLLMGLRKKINLFNTFIDGAKDGFGIAIKIIPYLVAMLVAIGVFRASGAMDLLLAGIEGIFNGLNYVLAAVGFTWQINTDFIPGLPVALMKPLSGSGARGLFAETMETYGVDSFVGRLAATFQGSTETTFFVLAVYFGSVGIKRTRYALGAGLIADFAGIIAAIFVAYIFFR